jgi:gliding motility-associated-like protein
MYHYLKRMIAIRPIVFIIFMVSSIGSFATHIVGGEFGLMWMGRGNNYVLTLDMYYDEINADKSINLISPQILVNIFQKGTNRFVKQVNLELFSSNTYIEYNTSNCTLGDLRTRILRYRGDLTLDSKEYDHPAGYYVSYELCCRNGIIENITNPIQTGMAYYMEFAATTRVSRNSAPKFAPIQGEYLCVDQSHELDFSAKDANGDSLVYSLTTPFAGHSADDLVNSNQLPAPYPKVVWSNTTYSENNMIPGSPPFSIDNKTGIVTVKPVASSLDNVYVIAVKVDEYRNGIKIGEVRREFQYKIIKCTPNFPPQIIFKEKNGTTYSEKDTIVVEFAQTLCLETEITDKSADIEDERITLSSSGTLPSAAINIQPKQFTLTKSNPKFTSEMCLTNCKPVVLEKDSVFSLQLIASDGACPVSETDTTSIWVLLKGRKNVAPTIGITPISKNYSVRIDDTLSFVAYATDIDPDDIITLKLDANGPNPFSFQPISGKDSISGTLTGVGNCELVESSPLELIFTTTDESCSPSLWDTTKVLIEYYDKPTTITSIQPINLITPNGDSYNDYFYLKDLPEGNCTFFFVGVKIYNRWGSIVYSSDKPDFQWHAKEVPSGIYYYNVNLNKKEVKGWLQVISNKTFKEEVGF